MNWNYGYHQSAGEPVTTAHKDHQLGPASDMLVVSCHLRRCEMLQLSFCRDKKICQLGYHPSFPAYGALPPRVSGSTWHFQAGLITHLPSQICARQTSGAAPKPGQLSWYRFVDEQSAALEGEHTQGSTEIRLLELQQEPQTKNKCLCSF